MGLLTAFGILFGERVFLFMLIFPMKAKHFVLILGLIELMTTVFSNNQGLPELRIWPEWLQDLGIYG